MLFNVQIFHHTMKVFEWVINQNLYVFRAKDFIFEKIVVFSYKWFAHRNRKLKVKCVSGIPSFAYYYVIVLLLLAFSWFLEYLNVQKNMKTQKIIYLFIRV